MKPAFILLALLTIAFVYVISRGPAPAMAGLSDTPGWLQWIGDRSKPTFDYRAIPPGCFDHRTKRFASICATKINPGSSTEQFRLLRLVLKSGLTAVAGFTPAPGDDSGLPSGTRTLKNGVVESFAVPTRGGVLTISCLPPGACFVEAE